MVQHRSGPRAAALLVALLAPAVPAQVGPGLRTFGTDDYVEIVAGSLPVVISAPHGGGLRPAEVADRSWGVTTQDLHTERLARELAAALAARTGRAPHLVVSHLHRIKLDPNREIVEAAQGDQRAERAWREYHAAIERARLQAAATWGRGLYVDVHGHGHALQRIEWGYALSAADYAQPDAVLDTQAFVVRSTLRHAASLPGARHALLLRGPDSLGGLLQGRGYAGVPSPAIPAPGGDPYFDGGYSVRRWGSMDGSTIDGVQIEFPGDLRRTVTVRRAMVGSLADAIVLWLERHLALDADGGTKISVQALDPVIAESGAPTAFRIGRTGPTHTAVAVSWAVFGTATQGTDVRTLPSVVTIPAGHAFVDVPVEPLPDAHDEGDETVAVQLFGGAEIGWPAGAEIVVRDDGTDPGLAVHLPLDVVTAGITPDGSGHGRSATLLPSAAAGPAPLAAGQVDAALAFDGVDDALRIDDHDYATHGSFTLAFWLRTPPPPTGASGFRYVFSHGAVGAASSLNVYFVESDRSLRTALTYANARTPLAHLDVPEDLMDGAWHHYALSARARGLSFVAIDGEVRAENPHAGDAYDPAGALFVGGRSDGSAARFFGGAVDDLRLCGRALGLAEIRALRAAWPGRVRAYGIGCPLTGAPTQRVVGRPETDRRVVVEVSGPQSAPAFLTLGFRDDVWAGGPLPFWLQAFGAPGCALWHDLAGTLGGATDPAGRAAFPLAFPRDPALVGQRLLTQALVLAPAANPLGLAVSSGLELTLGGQR